MGPSWPALLAFGGVCTTRAALDASCGRRLRPGGFACRQLALVPVKDLVFAAAWSHGLLSGHVVWRGKRIRVLEGTRIAPPPANEAPCGGRATRAA